MFEGTKVKVVIPSNEGWLSSLNGKKATIERVCNPDEFVVRLSDGTKLTLFKNELRVA